MIESSPQRELNMLEPVTGQLPTSVGDIEQLRTAMRTAPEFLEDPADQPHYIRYRYAHWPATEGNDGTVMAEEIIPEQELLSADSEREYNHGSPAVSRYMETNSLVHLMSKTLSPALAALGYSGGKMSIDDRGSSLIIARYPGVERFNDLLSRHDIAGFTLVRQSTKGMPSNEEVVQAFADGKVLSSGAYEMLMKVSICGLMAPEFIRDLQARARRTLDQRNLPATLTRDRFRRDETGSMAMSINSLMTVSVSSKLIAAVEGTGEGSYTPSAVDDLGFDLALKITGGTNDLVDHGRSYADQTVAHIRKLSMNK